jgi:hypothetical protein
MIVMAHDRALMTAEVQTLEGLAADLRRVFGERLRSVVAYGIAERRDDDPLSALALVDRLTFEDLAACAPLARDWRRHGLNVPLLLEREEFLRTLDVFPLEYGDIIARHLVIAGEPPFGDAAVADADIRRAIELGAKSHLIHLREGFVETGGDPQSVARLIAASAGPFRTILVNIARLAGETGDDLPASAERLIGIPAALVREVLAAGSRSTIADPTELLARYIAAAERIWEFVDQWRR